jgi:hypothetical protein
MNKIRQAEALVALVWQDLPLFNDKEVKALAWTVGLKGLARITRTTMTVLDSNGRF